MKFAKTIMTSVLLLCCLFPVSARHGGVKDLLIEKYQRQLKNLTTARDSVRVLYNLFDLEDRAGQKKLAWQIYETAGRALDLTSQMDMLRNLSVFYYRDDTVVHRLQSLADKIPNEEAKASTKTFIFNQHVSYRSGFPEDEQKLGVLLLDSIVNSHDLQGSDVYDCIALLFQIIQYIGTEAGGSLFTECMDKYATLVDRLPDSDYPLKNQFYTTSAIFNARLNGDQKKSVHYDKKLLEIMDMLQKMYVKKDRKHRNYDTNKFTSYRRMMSNFKVLSDSEIEEIHDSIMMLAARNNDVKETMDKYGRVDAYYRFAKGQYAEAIPFIKKALDNEHITVYQRVKLSDMLMKAGKATGNNRAYMDGLEEYVEQAMLLDSMRAVTTAREVMLRNSVSKAPLLNTDEDKIQPAKSDGKEIALMAVSGVLAVLLILYMVIYARLKRQGK